LEAFVLRQSFKTLLIICGLVLVPNLAMAETVSVELDQARLLRLPERVSTIIIGNPSIADGTLQSGGFLVVTGKGYGTTNLMALDAKGAVLAEHVITVSAPKSGLTVFRGADRETLNCAPACERAVVPGDAQAVFNSVIEQNGARNTLATGSAKQTQAPAR
jgi:Flp pilus assembly secretin CpaC